MRLLHLHAGGGLDSWGWRGDSIQRVRSIKNLKAARRRFYRRGNRGRSEQEGTSRVEVTPKDSFCVAPSLNGCVTSCEVCYAGVSVFLGAGCTAIVTSSLVGLACPPPATLACIGAAATATACACFLLLLLEDGYTAGQACAAIDLC